MEAHEIVTLQKMLSREELETLPTELKPRVEKVQNEFMEVFALYSTQRANLDGIREQNDQKIAELTEKYQDEFAKTQSSQICIQEQRQELDEARSELSKLTESVKRLDAELVGYRKERNDVIEERDTLMKRVDRQNFEVDRLEADIKALKQQVTSAINSKCEALSKYDEIQHKEANIAFKEKRMEQDKILLQNQIDCLTADLNRNVMELQKCRSETTSRTMTVEAKLYEKTEEVRIHTSTIAHLTDTNSSLNAKIEDLSLKLLAQSEEFAKMMEQYQKELLAKTKLADLYKENSEDSLNQQRDMTNAVNELKSTLKEATDEYGILETNCKATELQHAQEIGEKNKIIEDMQDELKNANKLLKLAQQESLDNAVEKLCPTAATTSRLIKSGKSLTEIYTLYVNVTEENQMLAKDNAHLKLRFQEVIQEIEEKAPLIHKQDLDLKLANEANVELSNQLESLIKDRVDSRGEIEELLAKIKSMEKQNKTLQIDRRDLGLQLCHLLKVIEEARGGYSSTTREHSITSNMSSSNDVITKRLLTFDDIQSLQHNNVQLMAIIRDLSSKIEEEDEIKNSMDQATYEEKIANYAEKFKTLQTTIDNQTRMVEKCIVQRDHYRKLYQDSSKPNANGKMVIDSNLNNDSFMEEETPHASNSSLNSAGLNSSIAEKDKKLSDMDSKIKEYEKQLKTLKEEYDIYRKEKHTNDEMLNKQFDTMRTELRELSTTNCKLQAQVEHHDCQLKLQQKNIATYKKQIQTLEERNKNYETTIIKHETSLAYLRDETMKATSNVNRSEMMIQKLNQDNRRLKEIESSLKAERDVLYRERQSQNLLQNNMEMIKVTFERLESEGKMRMEQRFDEITRECSALRRRLQEEQDHFRELSANCQRDTQTAKDRMEEEKVLATKYQEELNATREELEKKSAKIEDLSKKLQSSLTPTQSDNPVAQANKRVKELENKLKDNLIDLEALQKDLDLSRTHVKQYCDMAELAESQLQEMNEHKTRIDADYAECKKNEMQYRQRVEELETEISLDINNKQLMAGDTNTQLHKAQSDLKDALTKISENNRELRDLREKCNTVSAALEAAEQKYSNEMILHSSDIKNMARIKEEMTQIIQQFDQLKLARDSAVQQLATTRAMTKDRELAQDQEKLELETRLADMDKQNAALHDQIQTLSTKLSINVSQQADDSAIMNDSTADMSMNRSIAEEDGKSSDQLLQIIKYLRKEKDIAVAKFDILRSENSRLKSEFNLIQKKLDETQLALNTKQISESDTGSLNSAKHEELLRKVETLNAITDSNRILREERDGLAVKVKALSSRVTKVEDELIPLQEKNRELTAKSETVGIENVSLRTEATRWRQRANALVERSNKNSPDDWKRLQGERENLAKMLQAEKDQHKKTTDEFNSIKQEKTKMDNDIQNFTRQMAVLTADNKKNNEELISLRQSSAKMNQEMLEIKVKMDLKDDDLKKLAEELNNKEAQLTDIKNKEGQIRKIAKRYKDSYMELKKQVDEGTVSTIEKDDTAAGGDTNMGEPSTSNDQQTAEGNKELENKIAAMVAEIEQLKAAQATTQSENEELRQAMIKEERNKTLLSLAKTKLSTLSERKDQLTRELAASRTEREQSREESEMLVSGLKSQYETRINRLEKEVTDQVAEKAEAIQRLQRENENLIMRVNQLHRQMGSQQSAKPATSTMEKSPSDASRTANVKPMAGPSQQSATVQPWRGSSSSGDTPLASIRPISVQNSRTAAVMPTSQTANVVSVQGSSGTSTSTTSSSSSCSAGPSCASVTALVPPQQQVHTTASQPGEALSSSPTSSHTDYMPATSSATSSVVVAAIPPMGSSSNAAESSSQSQEVEAVSNESIQIITGGQPLQQAVALVSPRVESAPQQLAVQSQQQNEQNQAPSTSATPSVSQQLSVPMSSSHHQASSSNTVTTTQAGGHKRPRDVEGDSSTSNDEPLDKSLPLKRTRVQGSDTFQGVSESGLEVEYQVPTSSQRDQEDDVIVVDSEEEDEDDEALPDEGNAEVDGPFEDDGNENFEMEEAYEQEQEMANYDEGPDIDDDDIIQSVNNEVEVEDLSEVPNQSGSNSITQQMAPDAGSSGIGQSSASSSNQEQVSGQSEQQIQSITSGSGNGNGSEEAGPSTSGSNLISAATSQWRPTGQQSSARQQANIMHLNYSEEASDDRIVPSTPTLLFRRNEVDSSPNPALVPHAPHTAARFTFGDSSSSSRNASLNEGMDDTRIDLGSMEDHNNVSGRNVPSIPQQVSPGEILMNDSTSASTSSTSSSISTVILQQQDNLEAEAVAGSSSQEEGQVPEISITGADDDYDGASTSEVQDESDREKMIDPMCETDEGADGVSSEGEKTTTETTEDDTTSEADMLDQSPTMSRALRSGNVRGVQHMQHNTRRPRGGMRGQQRITPIVWNQQQQQQHQQMQQQQQQQQAFLGHPSHPFPSPNQSRGPRIRRGRGRGPASAGQYGNMRY